MLRWCPDNFGFRTVELAGQELGTIAVGYFLPHTLLFSKRRLFGFCSWNRNYLVMMSRHNNSKLCTWLWHEEGRPFNDPPLPHYAQGVPQTGSSQVGTLKPRSCSSQIGSVWVDRNHPQYVKWNQIQPNNLLFENNRVWGGKSKTDNSLRERQLRLCEICNLNKILRHISRSCGSHSFLTIQLEHCGFLHHRQHFDCISHNLISPFFVRNAHNRPNLYEGLPNW